MSITIAKGTGYTIATTPQTGITTVSVRADKIPNRHGYGHTVESGTDTRTYARMAAREHVGPRVDVSAAIDTFHVGGDLWRTYLVKAVAR